MLIDKDSSAAEPPAEVGRPPAVDANLWQAIPVSRREQYVRAAALGLRRGVHPETTIENLLIDAGWSPEDVEKAYLAGPVPVRGHEDDRAASAVVASPVAAVRKRATGMPLWAFGTDGYAVSKVPRGDIGRRLADDLGMAPDTAAQLEWQLHRAMSRDPSFVLDNPRNLRLMRCDISAQYLAGILDLVQDECERVIDDVRARKERRDPTAMLWIDPKDSIFGAFA